MAQIVERNIHTLTKRRREEDARQTLQERVANAITRFTGSMVFVYLHAAVYAGWFAINLGWIPGVSKFDPTFVGLATAASVEAIFLSTFILITQNRMAALADRRADLDLQVSLLAEHELTQLIKLVTAIAERLDVAEARSPELDEARRDVRPETVLDTMDHIVSRSAEEA
jgi:uncharacterized membrane protein